MLDNAFTVGTRAYEAWLGGIIELNQDELDRKHRKMKDDRFEFLRASFYRWAELWRDHAEGMGLKGAVEVLGVGDLHIENFGTWRDRDGRLAWGVNDFDEACPLPYANDIVRLAVSAELAIESDKTNKNFTSTVTADRAGDAIFKGYQEGMAAAAKDTDERRPFVLAENHKWLRSVVVNTLETQNEDGKTKFDLIVDELAEGVLPTLKFAVPPQAREALRAAFPKSVPPPPKYRVGQRKAGLGSLGRQRFTSVVDDFNGGLIAREAKALSPSAWLWANGRPNAREIWYEAALQGAVRSSDPWVLVYQGWVVRRLAPDAGKVKLDDLPPELDEKLLCAMGKETANIHSWSRAPLKSVFEDLQRRNTADPKWFREAINKMKELTLTDWEACKAADM